MYTYPIIIAKQIILCLWEISTRCQYVIIFPMINQIETLYIFRSPDEKQETIPYQICVDSGLQPPVAIQSCGLSQCPSWTAQAWIPCSQAKCIAKRTGFQTRDVFCTVGDKTVDDKYCEAVLRPRSTQKCRNRRCKGVWKTGLWSKVINRYFLIALCIKRIQLRFVYWKMRRISTSVNKV